MLILPPKKESKSGSKEPQKRSKFIFRTPSKSPYVTRATKKILGNFFYRMVHYPEKNEQRPKNPS